MNRLQTANSYLALGWSFYPIRPRSKAPYAELLPQGMRSDGTIGPVWTPFKIAPPTPWDIQLWFERAPSAGIAIVTGAVSNLVIVDIDNAAAKNDYLQMVGAASLTDLNAPVAVTNRGWHVYYAHPGYEVKGKLATGEQLDQNGRTEAVEMPNIDVKADGQCCTAPPSVHQSGHVYWWLRTPYQTPLPPLPEKVRAALRRYNDIKARRNAPQPITGKIALPGHTGNYGRVALTKAITELRGTIDHRNDALNAKAYGMGRLIAAGAIDGPTVQAALIAVGHEMGLGADEINATVRSGLANGIGNPRLIPELPARSYQHADRYGNSRNAPKYSNFPAVVR